MYKGPWKVPANKRTPKDPTAPKRPMSAFLAFSNKRRAGLKRENPDATNADLSKMLSVTWKEAPDELRKKYMEEEAALRATYKVEMAKWRKKAADEKKTERQEREAIAMEAAEARQNEVATGVPVGTNSQAIANQYAAATGQSNVGGTTNGGGGQDMGALNAAQMYGNPYANMAGAQLGGMGGGFGGMSTDPSQYANLMGAGGFGGQSGFMGAAAQQQLLNQLFGTYLLVIVVSCAEAWILCGCRRSFTDHLLLSLNMQASNSSSPWGILACTMDFRARECRRNRVSKACRINKACISSNNHKGSRASKACSNRANKVCSRWACNRALAEDTVWTCNAP